MHIFFENPNATSSTVVTNEMYNDGAGNIYIGTNRGITQIKGGTTGATTLASASITGAATVGTTFQVTGATTLSSTTLISGITTFKTAHDGVLHGAGTSSTKTTSTTAGAKFMSYYTSCNATSDDSRGLYLKHHITGIGGGGDAARFYGEVVDVAGATARGAHISLGFGTTGSITGLGSAITGTLHVPGAMTNGTYTVINAEINADAATSNLSGAASKSFFRVGAIGDGTGAALIMDDMFLFDFINAAGSGKMIDSDKTALTGKAGIPISINGTLYGYIPIVTGS